MSQRTFVIVGAGQAGGETAAELRKQGFDGRIVLIGDEAYVPYKRPPLSKAYMAGTIGDDGLFVSTPANLEKNGVEFRGKVRVEKIDRAIKTLSLSDGSTLAYDKLALTTGGHARRLNTPGADKSNVYALRTITDVQAIRAHIQPGKKAIIVGGGFIGLEVAAVLVKLGVHVTVLEGLPRVLARVTAPEISAFFERVHREAGVDLRTNVQITAFEGSPSVTHTVLGDGSRLDTDFVIAGIGLIANVELAQAAGLAVDNGIVVDETTQTSDADIVAAGDCTNHPSEFLGRRTRLESVQNAMEQGRAAARAMVGKPEPYRMVPWFWSDQYDCKLQMVGVSTGADQLVIRGDLNNGRSFAAFHLKNGKLIAADTVSKPQDFMLAKKMVALGLTLDPTQLADETVALKTLIPV